MGVSWYCGNCSRVGIVQCCCNLFYYFLWCPPKHQETTAFSGKRLFTPSPPPVFNFRSDCISVTTHVLTWKSTNLNVDSLAANAFSRYICPLEFELKKRKKFHRPLMWRLLGFNFVSPPKCSTLLNTLHFPTNKMLGFPPKMSLKYSDIAYHANRSTKVYNLYKLVDFIQQWNNPLNCLFRLA